MAYGTVKVDNITFTNGGSDQTITVSGIVQSISGDITATGTLQGATIIGTSTVSGATVTGNAGQFTTATAATGTTNFDADTQGVIYYTSNASADWTLNVRGSSSTTLNSKLSTGDSFTLAFLVTQGGTAYKHSALTIDGSAQTVKWSGGTAPSTGNASSIDIYQFTIIKTASATYTVLGAGPVKYA